MFDRSSRGIVAWPNEKEMPAPSYFANVAVVSHGRMSWQIHRSSFPNGASVLANAPCSRRISEFGVGFIGWLDVGRLRIRIILIGSLVVSRVWIPKGRELCCTCEKREAKNEVTDGVEHLARKRVPSTPIPTVDEVEGKDQ